MLIPVTKVWHKNQFNFGNNLNINEMFKFFGRIFTIVLFYLHKNVIKFFDDYYYYYYYYYYFLFKLKKYL